MFRLQELEAENKKLRAEMMDQLQKSIEMLADGHSVLIRIVQDQQNSIKDLQKRVRKLENNPVEEGKIE